MKDNPFQAPQATLEATGGRDVLVCPYCSHIFPLSWMRYFTEPWGKYKCPRCGTKSKLSSGASYWLVYLPILSLTPLIAGIVVPLFLAVLYFPKDEDLFIWFVMDTYSVIGIWAIVFLASLPIDRLVNVRYRKLLPIDETR